MRKFGHLFLILILFSCGLSPKDSTHESERSYFDFDEILHYRIEIEETEVFGYAQKENKTRRDTLLNSILTDHKPEKITDTTFLNSLEILPFKKVSIYAGLFKEFNGIFKEKKHKESIYLTCIPIYRDVFVFKKTKNIVGIAKICFTCGQHYIVGTTANTREFGQSGDYKMLSELLSKNKN